MGRKLTPKEKETKEILRIMAKIRNLEKKHPQKLVKSACYRYNRIIAEKKDVERRKATLEREMIQIDRKLKAIK